MGVDIPDVNYVWVILIFFTVFMVVYNGVISAGEQYLPATILELFRYGKTLNGPAKTPLIKLISVPKSYFTHFYILSGLYVPVVLFFVIQAYEGNFKIADSVLEGLDLVCSSDRKVSTSSSRLVLVLSLLLMQVWRRLYECVFVNQPSNSTMNITHYIVGYAHYFCATAGYICEAPGLARSSAVERVSLASLAPECWLLTVIFLAAWYLEFEAHKIFADLKIRNPKTHSIPRGSLFEFISCPHYLCEIIIYTCFMFILGVSHTTGVLVWFWVLTNQVIAATMSHKWYKEKFKEYPSNRKAILPFIY